MAGGVDIVLDGLGHAYRRRGETVRVLDGVDLHVPAGAYVSVMGSSGAGKSTLLAVLGGLEAPQTGTLAVGGRHLGHLDRRALAAYRRDTVGFVFQHFGLLDTLTATENVALPRLLVGDNRRRANRRARHWLDRVGLGHRAEHPPTALSGGERQRVAVARALVNEPALVLADEPTGNLDEETGAVVIDLLESLTTSQGATIVSVTHDRALAARADRHYRLLDGRLHEVTSGSPTAEPISGSAGGPTAGPVPT
jgi:predicted ABC-type transport system involved in lysophospholipase L1 biosynthesis ATPase subunit